MTRLSKHNDLIYPLCAFQLVLLSTANQWLSTTLSTWLWLSSLEDHTSTSMSIRTISESIVVMGTFFMKHLRVFCLESVVRTLFQHFAARCLWPRL